MLLTAEPDRVQAVLGPFDLQQQQEHLVVDPLALAADDDVHGPGDLGGQRRGEGVYSGALGDPQEMRTHPVTGLPCSSG